MPRFYWARGGGASEIADSTFHLTGMTTNVLSVAQATGSTGLPLEYTITAIVVVVVALVAVAYHISRPSRPFSEWRLPPGTHWDGARTHRGLRPIFGFWHTYFSPPLPSKEEVAQQGHARRKVADMMLEVKTMDSRQSPS